MYTPTFCSSLQIRDVAEARRFYKDELGCAECELEDGSLRFTLCGAQIDCQFNAQLGKHGRVDWQYHFMNGNFRRTPHCTVELSVADWKALARRLKQRRLEFIVEPVPLKADSPERPTLSILDPSGNPIALTIMGDSLEQLSRTKRMKTVTAWFAAACILGLTLSWMVLHQQSPRRDNAAESSHIPNRFFP